MDKRKKLKKLLIVIIGILIAVILSIPTIIKTNTQTDEAQSRIQKLEYESNNIKEDSKPVYQSGVVNNDKKDDKTNSTESDEANAVENIENSEALFQKTEAKNVERIEQEQKTSAPENTPGSINITSTDNNKITNTNSYILNKNTKKFHNPTCKSVRQMKDSNKLEFQGTRDEAIAKGYSPCKNCNP